MRFLITPVVLSFAILTFSGCSSPQQLLNPFYDPPGEIAFLGEPNDHALSGGGKDGKEGRARAALDAMASYQRTHLPQPARPVIQPAVIRLMWVPDHLNRNGDLVPAHYYYLKVLDDRPAVTDAFELQGQIDESTTGNSSHIPYTLGGKASKKAQ